MAFGSSGPTMANSDNTTRGTRFCKSHSCLRLIFSTTVSPFLCIRLTRSPEAKLDKIRKTRDSHWLPNDSDSETGSRHDEDHEGLGLLWRRRRSSADSEALLEAALRHQKVEQQYTWHRWIAWIPRCCSCCFIPS